VAEHKKHAPYETAILTDNN